MPPVPRRTSPAALLFVVGLAFFTDSILYYLLVPLLPHYAKSLGLSQMEVGVLFGAYASAILAGTWPLGRLADRIGRRKPFLWGLVGLGATTSSSRSPPPIRSSSSPASSRARRGRDLDVGPRAARRGLPVGASGPGDGDRLRRRERRRPPRPADLGLPHRELRTAQPVPPRRRPGPRRRRRPRRLPARRRASAGGARRPLRPPRERHRPDLRRGDGARRRPLGDPGVDAPAPPRRRRSGCAPRRSASSSPPRRSRTRSPRPSWAGSRTASAG